MQEMQVQSLGQEDLEKEMTTQYFYFFKLLWKKGGKKSPEYMGKVADCEWMGRQAGDWLP